MTDPTFDQRLTRVEHDLDKAFGLLTDLTFRLQAAETAAGVTSENVWAEINAAVAEARSELAHTHTRTHTRSPSASDSDGENLSSAALDAIEQRLVNASPGSWRWEAANPKMCGATWDLRTSAGPGILMSVREYQHGYGNAEFIAHAPDDIEALLAELRRLRDPEQAQGGDDD